MRVRIRKRQSPALRDKSHDAASALRKSVERQLSLASDMGRSPHDDPLYRVDETFRESFQGAGVKRYEEMSEEARDAERSQQEQREGENSPKAEEALEERAPRPEEALREKEPKREERPAKTQEGRPQINGAPLHNFSRMAFKRGELSAAVLQGTGKMALISCLKRSAGQPEQGRTLFGLGAQTSNVPTRSPDKMMFHRNFAQSAVGLVVDALRDARQTVDSLTKMADGTENFREKDGGATLHSMYPFLDDSRERALLDERRARLAEGNCTPEERAILENAAVRAKAMIAKKAQMKEEFIQKLRTISERAEETLAELERPETLEEAEEALLEADGTVPPPDRDASAEETETEAPKTSSPEETEGVEGVTETPESVEAMETPSETETPGNVLDA